MIRFITSHPTAANLLMAAFLLAGLLSLPEIRRETMPDFAATEVQITIPYPGATAQEVDESVCQRVEDALDSINYIREISSDAREGMAAINVEMAEGGNIQTLINDIETELSSITSLPPEVENPVITELSRTHHVLSLLISGPMTITDLKTYCEDLKKRFQRNGIPLVKIIGFSDHQLRIHLSDSALRRAGLSGAQIAAAISAQSRDIPLGIVQTREQDILLRFTGKRRSIEEFEDLIIFSGSTGGELKLRDVGTVEDLFEKDEEKIVKNGNRYAMLSIEKTKDQDSIRVAEKALAIIESEQNRHPQLELTVTQNDTNILSDRLNMLISNGIQGLILVFLSMWLFFNIRISFWVAMGLPVSFLGAFVLFPYLNMSINMFTMIGLLLALGIIMDDAIVIAENIMVHRQKGKSPLEAAITGTKEVAGGVLSSFATTICVLGPLAFIQGQIGKVLKVVPVVLILVLGISLIEAFFILPSHLAHSMHNFDLNKTNSVRARIDSLFAYIRDQLLGRTVEKLIRWRYLFFSSLIAIFILSLTMVASGKIKFQGFPDIEGDILVARVLMPQGTPLSRMESTIDHITRALNKTNENFTPEQPDNMELIQNYYVEYNKNADAYENGPHVATVTVDLLTAEKRRGTIDEYLADWRNNTGELPDIITLSFGEPGHGAAGRPVEIRLRGDDLNILKKAVTELNDWFSSFNGVLNLNDDLRNGKPELRIRLRDDSHNLGVNTTELINQLKTAFQGLKIDEIQIGSESYEIEVRLDNMDRDSLSDIESFNIILSNHHQIPLRALVDWRLEKSWARIARVDGIRTVTLRGDIDTRFINTSELINLFKTTCLPQFSKKYPDIDLTIEGSNSQTGTTSRSMISALALGMIGVFILLSFQFRSYTEPIIVMLAIPFSLIGVIWGHGIMGVPVSMPSILGFIALGGIVVNDSILLVMFMKEARMQGIPIHTAAVQASRDRFRAVLLTSSTTIAGLLPLLFERSLQAQILIPLVTSTAFGLMASTLLVLLGIPSMYMILNDLGVINKLNTAEED